MLRRDVTKAESRSALRLYLQATVLAPHASFVSLVMPACRFSTTRPAPVEVNAGNREAVGSDLDCDAAMSTGSVAAAKEAPAASAAVAAAAAAAAAPSQRS